MARPQLKLVAPAVPQAREPRSRATLASLCERAGDDLLDLVLAPHGLEVPVAGVCIHDPLDAACGAVGCGDVVLAPGAPAREQATDDLLAAVREAGAAAVVVRRRRPLSGWLLEAFEEAGVALLTTPRELPWAELHVLLLAALEAGGDRPPAGGLAGLADATAALAGGPVTIEDLEGRVLAFSEGGQDIDAARAATVLGRRVPDRWLRELRRRGVFDRLACSREAVHVDLPGLAPRRAVAILGAATTLGVIWLAGGDDSLSAAADGVLRDAALAASVQLTRDRAGEDLHVRMRGGALRMLLAGEGAEAPMLGVLGLPLDGEFAVVAVRHEGAAGDPALQRHADLLRVHLRANRLTAATGVLDGRVYGSSRSPPRPARRRWAAR